MKMRIFLVNLKMICNVKKDTPSIFKMRHLQVLYPKSSQFKLKGKNNFQFTIALEVKLSNYGIENVRW